MLNSGSIWEPPSFIIFLISIPVWRLPMWVNTYRTIFRGINIYLLSSICPYFPMQHQGSRDPHCTRAKPLCSFELLADVFLLRDDSFSFLDLPRGFRDIWTKTATNHGERNVKTVLNCQSFSQIVMFKGRTDVQKPYF